MRGYSPQSPRRLENCGKGEACENPSSACQLSEGYWNSQFVVVGLTCKLGFKRV